MSLNKIKINDTTVVNTGVVYDISKATDRTYTDLTDALGTNGNNVPPEVREGGMSIKFIQFTPANYSVAKTDGIETEPTGTLLNNASTITDGTYTANQLTDFSSAAALPSTLNSKVTYYISVTETIDEQEVTTYTTWVVTMLKTDDNKYVQFRLMTNYFSTTKADWQGIDAKPKTESHNLVESSNVNGFVFANNQPYIKELYINDAGILAGLSTIHNVYCGEHFYITFSNATKDTFVAATRNFTDKDEASGIISIFKYGTVNVVLGYIVVDWNLLNSDFDPVTSLNDISYNIDYSPSIKTYLQNRKIEENTSNIININSDLYSGDKKDLMNILSYADATNAIWFQWPIKRINYVNKIRYKARQGTVNFYKITYNAGEVRAIDFSLITSVQNESSNSIKEISVDVELLENQFIGINGAFYYSNTSDTYESNTINVSTGNINSSERDSQILAYEYINDYSLENRVNNLDSVINDLENNINSVNQNVIELSSQVILGDRKNFSVITQTANNIDNIWFQWPKTIINHINKICYKTCNGVTSFYKVTLDETTKLATAELIISDTSTEAGLYVELSVDVDLLENQFIGINGKFNFSISNTQGYYGNYFNISTGILNLAGKDAQIFAFEALNTETIESKVELLKSEVETLELKTNDIGKYSVLLNEKLTSSKDFIVETQLFGTFGLIVNNYITINKWYSLSQRSAKFLCKFASDTVAVFETVTDVSTTGSGNTYFTLNINSKTCQCRDLQKYYCDILMPGDIISVDMIKEYGVQQITITNITLGKSQTFSWRFNGTGGVGEGAIGTIIQTGMQWDYYRLRKASGSQFEVAQVVITSPKADVVLYGDSITNGESYWPAETLHEHWVQLIVDKMKDRAVASGRSGMGINQMFNWMQNEIPFIRPKYVMITIGTNGGVTQEKLNEIVEYIESIGSTPILNHIPANINSGGRSNHVAVNQIIDVVRSNKNISGADFDLVTSINGVPSDGVNTTMMWMEDYGGETGTVYHHPNALGSLSMFHKMMLDIPQVFE